MEDIIMSKLVTAMTEDTNYTRTTNGMMTHKSSLDACVDFFYQAGSSRGRNVVDLFSKAYVQDAHIATRLALYLRDARGGQGERQLFKDVFAYILGKDTDVAGRVLARVPELGRWDDVLVAFNTPLENQALQMIKLALEANDGLCAKWMPRPNGKGKENANKIRKFMNLTPKAYRKMLVDLTNVVEQQMCAKDWDNINYSHVPSLAAARYQAAFSKNDPVGYTTYREGLKKGDPKVKVNAAAVYPYDVIKSLRTGDRTVSDAQWKALPDYLGGSEENIMPMVDVSGSMCAATSINGITCMDVALSLGLYLSERSNGIFKDSFMTFSTNPEIVTVKGDLSDRMRNMSRANWAMSTNLEAAFSLMLRTAVQHSLPASEMPTQILILSDMQFNSCVRNWNARAIDMIRSQYEAAGYKMPKVVFWNLKASVGQSPVTADENGTALVSGFSPSIMAAVLGADPEEFTPRAIMLKKLSDERYDF